jgi:hypothetical protein
MLNAEIREAVQHSTFVIQHSTFVAQGFSPASGMLNAER